MAPIKFEDNIREQLQEREIQPSANAWERLESRLGDAPKKGLSRRGWIAVAASFVGILILASVFWNSDPEVNNNDLVVEERPSQESNNPVLEDANNELPQEEIQQQVALEAVSADKKYKEATGEENAKEWAEKKIRNTPESGVLEKALAENDVEKQANKEVKAEINRLIDENDFINSKVVEVVADVKKLESQTIEVTPEEIDALLIAAQREITNNRILNSERQKVDAAALLMDVEFELERSFRDKVFDALGEGYKRIRTAVAERNY